MLLLFTRDSKDSTTLEWLAPIKPLVRSSLAVIRLSDPSNELQEIFFRYCEENGHSQSAVCIIEPHPTMNRFLMSGQTGDKNLRLFVQDWAEKRISPYLKVENVLEKRIGNVQVAAADQVLNSRTLDGVMASNDGTQKVILIYKERDETSRQVLSLFFQVAENLKFKPAVFCILNLDKNELPDFDDIEIPSLVALKGFGDLEASNYEGAWSKESLTNFILAKL